LGSALGGIKVVELSRFIAAPYCGMMLADLGADVIKVEDPMGDPSRKEGPWFNGESLFFTQMNRNKRAIVLDLKTTEGKGELEHLIQNCDVLIENFRPGVMERLGLGPEILLQLNPRCIVARISGFGSQSEMSNRPAYDCILQSMSGLAMVSGTPDDAPMLLGTYPVDSMAGSLATTAILAAINQRHHTGVGQVVEVSLLDAAIALLGPYAAGGATGQNPERLGNADRELAPANTYRAKDGWIYIHAGLEHFWRRLANLAGLSWAVEEARFATDEARKLGRAELEELISKWVSGHSVSDLESMLGKEKIPVGRVHTVAEAFADERLGLKQRIRMVEGPNGGLVPVMAAPLHLHDSPIQISRGAPKFEGNKYDK
jgi:crotonobetainyl-CoA:carnitine CoA-transferase CaiB-like acyl-CoA transferase